MKKNIIIILFLISLTFLNAQTVTTNYTRGLNSSYCENNDYKFEFAESVFKKIDSYGKKKTYGPSMITQSNFDNNGYFFEVRMPNFLLEYVGINEYNNSYYHFSHKILYDRKGGEILYIYEIDDDSKQKSGTFYFTNAGYKIFCN